MPLVHRCAICDAEFKSLLLDRKQATAEIGPKFQQHLKTEHKQEFEEFLSKTLGQITLLASGIAVINHFVVYEPDDEESLKEFETNVDSLMKLMGFSEDEEAIEAAKEKEPKKSKLIVMPNSGSPLAN